MTWQDIFNIIEKMWDVKQANIANCLGVHPSTVSRLMNGKQQSIHCTINEIYDKLFNPSNPKSLAYRKDTNTERQLLAQLKDILHELELDDVTNRLSQDNYEKFMKGMLKSVKEYKPQISSISKGTVNPTPEYRRPIPHDDTSPEEMFYEFYKSCHDYGIEDFIAQNPFESLSPYQIEDAIHFIGHVTSMHKRNDNPDKDSILYQHIISFTDTLLEYIKALKSCSDYTKAFPEAFTPVKSNDMVRKLDSLRKHLISIHQVISADIKDKQEKYWMEQRAANKKIWEESSCKGTLFKSDAYPDT